MTDFTLLLGPPPPPLKIWSSLQQHKGHLTQAGCTVTFTPSVASTKPPFLWQPPPVVKRNLSGIPVLEPHKGERVKPAWAGLLRWRDGGGGALMLGRVVVDGGGGADSGWEAGWSRSHRTAWGQQQPERDHLHNPPLQLWLLRPTRLHVPYGIYACYSASTTLPSVSCSSRNLLLLLWGLPQHLTVAHISDPLKIPWNLVISSRHQSWWSAGTGRTGLLDTAWSVWFHTSVWMLRSCDHTFFRIFRNSTKENAKFCVFSSTAIVWLSVHQDKQEVALQRKRAGRDDVSSHKKNQIKSSFTALYW